MESPVRRSGGGKIVLETIFISCFCFTEKEGSFDETSALSQARIGLGMIWCKKVEEEEEGEGAGEGQSYGFER